MSEKKVKQARQAEMHPEVTVTIKGFKNGLVAATGFPANFFRAMALMHEATMVVANYFVEEAKRGNVDERGFVKQSPILVPDKRILTPGGRG